MAIGMDRGNVRSAEFEIDQSVDSLIRKLLSGELTREEEALYLQLLAQRSKLMRSAISRPRRAA